MRKSNEQSLKEVLKEMVEVYRLKSKLNQTKIRDIWAQNMGKVVASYTSELYIRRKKLYVKIDSAPLKQELSFGKEKIKKMVNEELGEDIIETVVIL